MDAKKILGKATIVLSALTVIVLVILLFTTMDCGGSNDKVRLLSDLKVNDVWLMVIVHAVLTGSLSS